MAKTEYDRKYTESYEVAFTTPEEYIDGKIVMLRNEMYINPTLEEINHLYSLKTEGDIDRAVHSIIDRHWG